MNSTHDYTPEQILDAGRAIKRHTPGNGFCLFVLADLSGGAWYQHGDHPEYDRAAVVAVPVPEIRAVHHPRSTRAYGEYVARFVSSVFDARRHDAVSPNNDESTWA